MKKGLYSLVLLTALSFSADMFSNCAYTDGSSVDALFNPETEVPLRPFAPPSADDCQTASDILALITPGDPPPLIDAPAILRENIYKSTVGPVTRRSLLDEPALMPDWLATDCWSIYIQPFYNFSPHVFFTENSPFLCSYIDLTNQNIVNEISARDFVTVNVPEILGLFTPIKLQQHRAGFMFGLSKVFDRWAFSFRLPLYYLLEHFFLTNKEIDRIKNSPFIAQLQLTQKDPSGCDENEAKAKEFVLQHLVSDRVGIGDSRLNLMWTPYCTSRTQFWLGLRMTLPTASTITSALLGGRFAECSDIPPFNVKRLFNTFFCANGAVEQKLANEEIQRTVTDFLVGTLDRLSTILINTPLGNGKHFGAGPEVTFKYNFNDYFSMQTYVAVEAFTKHKERRFFLVRKNQSDFDRNFRTDNAEIADANLAFLNQQIINTLYPRGVKIEVKPGLSAQVNHSFRYDTEHWNAHIGFDYWHQGKERLGAILKGPPIPLVIEKGIRPPAQQGKVFAGFGYYGCTPCRGLGWHLLVNADATVFNKGIGESYTLGILLGIDF